MIFRKLAAGVAVAALLAAAASASALVLVRDGAPEAVIVIAADAGAPAVAGAQELQYHLQKMSGAKLEIVAADKAPQGGTRMVLIGRSPLTDKLGVDLEKLGPEGFVVKTVGNALVLAGDDAGGAGRPAQDVYNGLEMHCGSLFAVYEFLQDRLGCAWIWPGPTGESIPRLATVEIGPLDYAQEPALVRRHMRLNASKDTDASARLFDMSALGAHNAEERQWYRRMRMGGSYPAPRGHSLSAAWWNKYGKTHPDIFALLAKGKRGYIGNPRRVKMCVSNPELWDLELKEFALARVQHPDRHALDACESEGRGGFCTCPRCKAWDATLENIPPAVLNTLDESLVERLAPGKDGLPLTLSTRYARWYNELARRVREIDPEGYVTAYAITSIRDMPIGCAQIMKPFVSAHIRGVKLEPNLLVAYVGFNSYPRTLSERAADRRDFLGWAQPGVRMALRPNAPHYSGDGMPCNVARQQSDDFIFALNHNVIMAEYDAMIGYWASWGPTYYVLTQLMWEGKTADPERIMDEWYGAFGPAERQIRAYYDYWEACVASARTRPGAAEHADELGASHGSPRGGRLLAIPDIYTPEALAEARALLKKAAEAAAKADESVKAKIENVEMGLCNAELTARAMRATLDAEADPAKAEAATHALQNLIAYRRSIATRDAVNVYWETEYEITNGDVLHWKTVPDYAK